MRCPACNLDDIDEGVETCPRCGVLLRATGNALAAGALFMSRYIVERAPGRNAAGFVYLVRDLRLLGRTCVLEEFFPEGYLLRRDAATGEVVAPDSSRDSFELARRRFIRQATTLARLSQPNLARILDYFAENGTAYLVREHVSHAHTLREELKRQPGRALPPARVHKIAAQLVSGLEAAHGAGLLHLDISPDNILLTDDDRAVLVNFGWWRVGLTSPGAHFSPADGYVAPEVFTDRHVGPQSDIFSLGTLLYEMLTGRRPPSVFDRGFRDAWGADALPAEWRELVSSALRLWTEDRPASVREWWAQREPQMDDSPPLMMARPAAAAPSAARALRFPLFGGDEERKHKEERKRKLSPLALLLAVALVGGALALMTILSSKLSLQAPAGGEYAGAPSDRPGEVTVERYPTMECPEEVGVGQRFAVLVSLTEDFITPGVTVPGRPGGAGKIPLRLPDRDEWEIEVVLSGDGFDIDGTEGKNISTLTLPKIGDSTAAQFEVRAKPTVSQRRASRLYATLSHEGKPLTRIAREVTVEPGDAPDAPPRKESVSAPLTEGQLVSAEPDLTLDVMQSRIDPRNWEVRVFSRHLPAQVQYNTLTLPADFEAKLRSEYRKLAGLRARDVSPDEGARPVSASSAQSQMRGFGGWLYEKLATENLKGALRDLPELKTIKIYTNNPVLPWELMCPPRKEGGACRFLGTEYAVGRLPLADGDTPSRADPPQTLLVDNLTVIAPSYEGAQALPSQAEELRGLETFPGYRLCPGRLSDVSELFAGRPRGIIHFAGHGSVKPGDENIPEYTINLEDGPVDLMALRDMARGLGANHPLFFFNACSVGQAQQVANTLDGLAPAMLEAGAGGYVGALWPLNDRSAARFGVDFYKALALRLQEGRASVAEVLRDVRRKFLENNDPTFLAYVFYGDPNLTAYR